MHLLHTQAIVGSNPTVTTMSIKFNQVKTKLGLDDVLSFGRHQGYTVEEVIKDRPEYISWLIAEGKQFYQSVHEELAMYKGTYKQAKPKLGGYNHEVGDYVFDSRSNHELDDWFDDIPF